MSILRTAAATIFGALALFLAYVPSSDGSPAALDSIRLALFYHPPRSAVSDATLIQQVGSMVLTRGDEGFLGQARGAGFAGPALQYVVANEASGPPGLNSTAAPCGSYLYYPADATGLNGDFCTALDTDESNFLHNGQGQRLYSTESWQQNGKRVTVELYMMNPASPQWQSYIANTLKMNGPSLGYTGVFLDNVDLSLYRAQSQEVNSDGTVQEYSSDAPFRQAVQSYLANLRAQVGSMPLWANLTSGDQGADDWDQYQPYLDGVMDEAFVAGWNGSYPSVTDWQSELQGVATMLNSGKNVMAVAQGSQNDTQRMQFALASYLLVADAPEEGLASFRYTNANSYDTAVWLYPPYADQLGDPLSAASQQANGVWERDFACGTVQVDPVAHTGTISVTGQGAACAAGNGTGTSA